MNTKTREILNAKEFIKSKRANIRQYAEARRMEQNKRASEEIERHMIIAVLPQSVLVGKRHKTIVKRNVAITGVEISQFGKQVFGLVNFGKRQKRVWLSSIYKDGSNHIVWKLAD